MRNILNLYGKIVEGKMIFFEDFYKEKIKEFLSLKDGEFHLIIRRVRDAKSLAQLKYFYGVIVPMFARETGNADHDAVAYWLKKKFLSELKCVGTEEVVYVPSLELAGNEIDKPRMALFISDCVNFAREYGMRMDVPGEVLGYGDK